jgi:hypothetical protein
MSIHINMGRARREAEPNERCFYCDKHFKIMAYTYFGAAVCSVCWDSRWRSTEDGECDPPFHEITNQRACLFLDR